MATTDPHELLDTSPYADDLEEVLAAHPPRAKLPALTVCLSAGVVLVAGFIGGIYADQTWGEGASAQTASPRPGQFPAGQVPGGNRRGDGPGGPSGFSGQGFPAQGQGQGFPRQGQGAGTEGTVVGRDGDTLLVKTADGRTVKVKLTEKSQVVLTREGEAKDLTQGVTVVVRGQTGQDGTVEASSVTRQVAGR